MPMPASPSVTVAWPSSVSDRAERNPWSRPGVDGLSSYNGEIYNHPELRHRLERAGTRFNGESDTEVLVASVERWGIDPALDTCEGMFAAALWDKKNRQLHLVRDRFGEKPLYYGWVGTMFAFGSELKTLCALPGFAAELDRGAVAGTCARTASRRRTPSGVVFANCGQATS